MPWVRRTCSPYRRMAVRPDTWSGFGFIEGDIPRASGQPAIGRVFTH
jgi:hypothetical protein